MAEVRCAATGRLLVERLWGANTRLTRLRGLLGTTRLPEGTGLHLAPCRQVHMIGMRYPIDVVFLDEGNRIVRLLARLEPMRLSPSVPRAGSVIELAAGESDRLGLKEGMPLVIDGDIATFVSGESRLWPLTNALACLVALVFAAVHLQLARSTGTPAFASLAALDGLTATLLLLRRPSQRTSSRFGEWAMAWCTHALLLVTPAASATGRLGPIALGVQAVGILTAVAGLVSLGRSLGLAPADRGIQTGWAYKAVRHPLYTGYALTFLGGLLSNPTAVKVAIGGIFAALLWMRAKAEEGLLCDDPTYRQMLRDTPWRFVPGML